MLRLDVIDRGTGVFEQQIRTIEATLPERMEGAMESVEPRVQASVDADFDAGGRPPGGPWQPLAPATVKRKGHAQILVDKGDMRKGFTFPVERDGDDVVMYAENSVRSRKGGSLFHLHWDGWDAGNLPSRKSGTIADAEIEAIADAMIEQLDRTL